MKINRSRLLQQVEELARIGAVDGGCSRLALSDEDKQARDCVVGWMRDAGMEVSVDRIGNIIAVRPGTEDRPPVMTGSHIDTVTNGGRLDGSYGVLAGLEVARALDDHGVKTVHPIAVTVFTNEEGVRYTPDMMGSLVYAGGFPLDEALGTKGRDGTTVGEELQRIGYAGETECGALRPSSFVELHIEQGPMLEKEGIVIGAVEDLIGISWQELTFLGQANHAGTTPMEMRRDPGLVAAKIVAEVREICTSIGGSQRGTCGSIRFHPGAINVIPSRATMTVDLRNTVETDLRRAEEQLAEYAGRVASEEGVDLQVRQLVQFPPVKFDQGIVGKINASAEVLGYSVRRMTSGACHDAQMMARICAAAMIFVPSRDGVSHNPAEYTDPDHLEAGANVLLNTMLELSQA